MDLSVEHRSRYETYNHPFRKDDRGDARQLAQRTRFRFEIKEKLDPLRIMVEFQDARAHLAQGSPVSNDHINKLDILQLRLELVSNNLFRSGMPSVFQFGRHSMDFGSRRLFARHTYRNTTNAFDGLHWSLGDKGRWQLRSFLANPVVRLLTQLDRRDKKTLFWGVEFTSRKRLPFQLDLYYFGIRENQEKETRQRRYSTFGIRLSKDAAMGELDYEVGSAWQFGSRADLDHFAYLQHAELGYTFPAPWRPRFSAQYQYASGDRDPNDLESGAFDTLFGASRFEFGPTGIWDPFTRSNISTPGYRLSISPARSVKLTVAHRIWWLAQARDAWAGSGLRDPSGRSGTFLGHHFETWMRWAATRLLALELGYAYFAKGSFPERVPDSPGMTNSHYLYIATEIRF